MSDWETIDSPSWKKILQHRFFTAFNKDLYIEDLLNEVAKTVSEQDQKLVSIKALVHYHFTMNVNELADMGGHYKLVKELQAILNPSIDSDTKRTQP